MSNQEPQENQSELRHLLKLFDLEYEAAQRGLTGLAYGVSKHDFINQRIENVAHFHERIEKIAGPDEARKLITERMRKITQPLSEGEKQ